MIETMRMSGPVNRQWWAAYFWYVVNLIVGAAIALVITAYLGGGRWLLDGYAPSILIFLFLALFFAFVWPPIPKIELAIRALLRPRGEAGSSNGLEGGEPLVPPGSDQGAGQRRLHVPKREIADRRSGEE
jgi:hypothetical protein